MVADVVVAGELADVGAPAVHRIVDGGEQGVDLGERDGGVQADVLGDGAGVPQNLLGAHVPGGDLYLRVLEGVQEALDHWEHYQLPRWLNV